MSGSTITFSVSATQVFFKGKLISRSGGAVQEDVRGSVGSYYPYGEDRVQGAANDAVKFATYTRDSVSGLDYAVSRYHLPGMGRFTRPDPYGRSARGSRPSSWNRYLYVNGDPINGIDKKGLCEYILDADEEDCDPDSDPGPGNSPGDEPGSPFQSCDEQGCYFDSNMVDKTAESDLANLSQGCEMLFAATTVPSPASFVGPPPSVMQALAADAGSTIYVDARTQANTSLASITGLNISGTVASVIPRDPATGMPGKDVQAVTVQVNNVSLNVVILTAAFFGLTQSAQDTVLLHELLHVVLQGHQDIANALGFAGPKDNSQQGWNDAIGAFLNGNCGLPTGAPHP